jgi:hypothetical protein
MKRNEEKRVKNHAAFAAVGRVIVAFFYFCSFGAS